MTDLKKFNKKTRVESPKKSSNPYLENIKNYKDKVSSVDEFLPVNMQIE